MTLIRWEPFRELDDVFSRYSPYFSRLAAARAGAVEEGEAPAWTPVANISETEADYLIKAELPEVSKEDVKVTVDENVITISGERRKEAEHKDEKVTVSRASTASSRAASGCRRTPTSTPSRPRAVTAC
jgi:HSP20 family protein